MKIKQAPGKFQPISLVIDIESAAELATLRLLARRNQSIPALIRNNPGDDSYPTPKEREDIARTFLKCLERAMEPK
jgi:hypothetical protein